MITHVKGCWVVHYDEDLEVSDGFRSVKATTLERATLKEQWSKKGGTEGSMYV